MCLLFGVTFEFIWGQNDIFEFISGQNYTSEVIWGWNVIFAVIWGQNWQFFIRKFVREIGFWLFLSKIFSLFLRFQYGLCRKLLEEPAPPGFYILRKKKGRKKINYAGLNNMYESFMQKQFKWKREERLYSRLLGMVNLLAIIIKGQYLKNQSTEVAHSWMWHVNRQEAEAILRSEPTRKPGYFCVRQRADIEQD